MEISKYTNFRFLSIVFIFLFALSLISIDTESGHCTGAVGPKTHKYCGGDWSRDLEYQPKFIGYSMLLHPEILIAPYLFEATDAYDAYYASFGDDRSYWIYLSTVELVRYSQKATPLNLYILPIILRIINIAYLLVLTFCLQRLWHWSKRGKIVVLFAFIFLLWSFIALVDLSI